MHGVWDSIRRSVPTKIPPFLKQQDHIQEEQEAMNQRPWMRPYWLWGERKVSLFKTPSTEHHQFSTPFQPKRKNRDIRKKDTHTRSKKNRRKVKRNQIS